MRSLRFRLKTLMVLIAACALGLGLLLSLWPLIPPFRSAGWSAGKDVPVDILVVDHISGRPIAGASVRANHTYRPDLIPAKQGSTDARGRVRLATVARAWGKEFLVGQVVLRKTEHLSFAGGNVQAGAEGYEPDQAPLDSDPTRATITLRLRPLPPRRGVASEPSRSSPR